MLFASLRASQCGDLHILGSTNMGWRTEPEKTSVVERVSLASVVGGALGHAYDGTMIASIATQNDHMFGYAHTHTHTHITLPHSPACRTCLVD